MNNKVIYIITTYKCSACKLMECILKSIQKENNTFDIEVYDFMEVPYWLSINVPLNDYPTIIFTDENVIKYHFTGTKSKSKVLNIMKEIGY